MKWVDQAQSIVQLFDCLCEVLIFGTIRGVGMLYGALVTVKLHSYFALLADKFGALVAITSHLRGSRGHLFARFSLRDVGPLWQSPYLIIRALMYSWHSDDPLDVGPLFS